MYKMFLVIVESIKTIRVPFDSFLFFRFLQINCLSIRKTICPSGTICPSFEPFVHRVTLLSKVDLQSSRLNHCPSGDHLSIWWTICPSSVSGETIFPSCLHLSFRWPFVHQGSSLGEVGGVVGVWLSCTSLALWVSAKVSISPKTIVRWLWLRVSTASSIFALASSRVSSGRASGSGQRYMRTICFCLLWLIFV